MAMKSGMAVATSILLLLLAGLAATHGEVDTANNIRLPSDGKAVGRPGKPWGKCCDNIEMSPRRIFPPLYRCNDEVKQCDDECKECVEAPGDFPRGAFVCGDWYQTTDPGPLCTERPWGKCCDKAACFESLPPICRCMDKVKQCAAACKKCKRVKSSEPPRYVCLDQFKGEPGPQCTSDTRN